MTLQTVARRTVNYLLIAGASVAAACRPRPPDWAIGTTSFRTTSSVYLIPTTQLAAAFGLVQAMTDGQIGSVLIDRASDLSDVALQRADTLDASAIREILSSEIDPALKAGVGQMVADLASLWAQQLSEADMLEVTNDYRHIIQQPPTRSASVEQLLDRLDLSPNLLPQTAATARFKAALPIVTGRAEQAFLDWCQRTAGPIVARYERHA